MKRLGGQNFGQIPINRPQCPMHDFQRDGQTQMKVSKGQVDYDPNSMSENGPREDPARGYQSFAATQDGPVRSETFTDYFSQARQFFFSQTAPEQNHIIAAIKFELSKVETPAWRPVLRKASTLPTRSNRCRQQGRRDRICLHRRR